MTETRMIDPLGRELILDDRTWYGHILKSHPEIAELRNLVELAIKALDEIHISRLDANCLLYYAQGPRSSVMMVAVADLSLGIIKTAHLARKPLAGLFEWSKST